MRAMAAAGAGTIVVVAVLAALLAMAPFSTAAGANAPDAAAGTAVPGSPRPQPGEALTSVLDELVQEEVLTRSQADAIAVRMRERIADWKERSDRRREMQRVASRLFPNIRRVAQEATGLTREEFAAAWRDGHTFGDIAGTAGVTRKAVVAVLVESAEGRIRSWLSSGLINDDQALRLGGRATEGAVEVVGRLWESSRDDRP